MCAYCCWIFYLYSPPVTFSLVSKELFAAKNIIVKGSTRYKQQFE